MPKTQKGYHWVKITDEQYRIAHEMCEPDTRTNTPNQMEPISIVVGDCIEKMNIVPRGFIRRMRLDPMWYHKALQLMEPKTT